MSVVTEREETELGPMKLLKRLSKVNIWIQIVRSEYCLSDIRYINRLCLSYECPILLCVIMPITLVIMLITLVNKILSHERFIMLLT
jgi:hypothetical protein